MIEPGDLLVVRNVGNLVPRHVEAQDRTGASVPAAIELAVHSLRVPDVIVCGHSECAAMRLIHSGERPEGAPHLAAWLRHGESAREGLGAPPPTPSWGGMLDEGRLFMLVAPHALLVPAAALATTVLALQLVGDGLRDVLELER